MKRHLLFVSTVALTTALMGAARAQTPAGAPPAVAEPVPAAAPPPSAPAADDTAAGFGLAGQLAISGDLQATVLHESVSMGGGSATAVQIQPSLDYFVAPNVSVGGALTISHGSSGSSSGSINTSSSSTSIGIAARAGYNLHLAPMISFWPQLQLGYVHSSFSAGGMDSSGYTFSLAIFAPLLVHIAPHLFVGIGPVFSTDLISKVEGNDNAKTTDIGITSVVGGYFGG